MTLLAHRALSRPGGPLSASAASNVRAEAARRGLNQAALAELLHMSRMALSDRYRGKTPWTLDELDEVARLFGVPLSVLLEPVVEGAGDYLPPAPPVPLRGRNR